MLASIALGGEQLAALVLARGIADLGGAAAHQHDRLVPGLLQPAQHHDLDQAADMERRRGRVEADIAGHDLLLRERVQPLGVGDLVDIAARCRAGAGDRTCTRLMARRALAWRGACESAGSTHRWSPHPDDVRARGRRGSRSMSSSAGDRGPGSRCAIAFAGVSTRRSACRRRAGPGARRRAVARTCFEAVPRGPEATAYLELNFSPSTQWAAYRFDGLSRRAWRERPRCRATAEFERRAARSRPLRAARRRSRICCREPAALGLSAVIEEADGTQILLGARPPAGRRPISTIRIALRSNSRHRTAA